ncbi:MAG TPA: two-component regulator propeller domain-containing protein, partial [Chitinophagaceae bacterium]|nr:two-component regulator propeller domain-containing protein [Chitinophagaceae bacterium]
MKDSRGILWIGTLNGLNRYDGAHFYSYKTTIGPNPVTEFVADLCEDNNGDIWGATANGVFRFLVKQNKVKKYPIPGNRLTKGSNNIQCNKFGEIWVTGSWNVVKYNKETDSFVEMIALSKNMDSLNLYTVRKNGMLEDPTGNGWWLATRMGMHYYDTKKNECTSFKNSNDTIFQRGSVSAFTKSHSGNYIFFDNVKKDIVYFNPATRKIKRRINIAKELIGSYSNGGAMFETKDHHVWFSSTTYEILVIDLASGKTTPIKHLKDDILSVAGDFFWDVMEDDDGTIWLGTVGGISRTNPEKSVYRIHRLSTILPIVNKDASIVVVEENKIDKSWWIATSDKLVFQYFPETGKYWLFDFNKVIPGITGREPGGIWGIRFIDNAVLICTQNGSWLCFPESGIVKEFLIPGDETRVPVWDMITTDDTIYYFNVQDAIIKWNKITGELRTLNNKGKILSDGQKAVM